MKWVPLGHGSYNMAYRNEDSTLVFKVAMNHSPNDLPERSVRLWNLLNPNIQPPARIAKQKINGRLVKGWICPFVKGVQANDKEIRGALLDIFNRTGRIIMDANARENFLRTPSGDIVCIDIGHALEMEHRETVELIGIPRKPSLTSLETYDEYDSPGGRAWLNKREKNFPKSIRTIKALSFIKLHRPDITNVNFLKRSPKTIKLLAKAYDKNKGTTLEEALNILEVKCSLDLETAKRKTREILWGYLSTKGTLINDGLFLPYKEYKFDEEYLQKIMTMLRQINTARTCDECREIVSNYIESLPAIEFDTEIISPSIEEPIRGSVQASSSASATESTEDFGHFLEDLENEIDDILNKKTDNNAALTEIKTSCRIILSGILLINGKQEDSFPEPEANMGRYKAEMAQKRMNIKIEKVLYLVNSSANFDDLMTCLDDFCSELPALENNDLIQNNPLPPYAELLASVNICKRMVKTAMDRERGQEIHPLMK